MTDQEKVYYESDKVKVTNTRAIFYNTTYALANITLTFNLLFCVWVVNVLSSGSFVSESGSGSFISGYPGNHLKDSLETPGLYTETWKHYTGKIIKIPISAASRRSITEFYP